MDIKKLINDMTLEEKASLCSGHDMWHTKAIERLGISAILVSDGPHGLRKQPEGSDTFGINVSIPATCFPPACTTASSWDPDLLRQIGAAIGEECLQEQVSVLLGPGVNIKRNPLCGRNFEYYSEDPFLSGELAAAFIVGVQAQGIGTSLKHFAANNQETRRMTIDAIVDERALREIYLPGFEKAVKQAHPWTVMCAYNRLNGIYCSEQERLLTSILRAEWGFDGVLLTDWGACNDRTAGLAAGQDLEMPGGLDYNDQSIVAAVKSGLLAESVLDRSVERLLTLIARAQDNLRSDYHYNADEHHALARMAATQSAVLLKNDENILPLATSAKLAIIGNLAKKSRYQGSGSSLINPTRLEHALDVLGERSLNIAYADGYDRLSDNVDEQLLADACQVASSAEVVVVFVGLTELAESEGFDREHMRLPANQNILIERLAGVSENLIVVLLGGSPVEMPWIGSVKALLNMYLPGQAGGSAVVDLLFGNANPCGKLAETYPLRYTDTASARNFPGGPLTVEYRESIYIGYRYFDTARQDVLFPFGHGLSYTNVTYDRMALSAHTLTDKDTLQVSVIVTNSGSRAGAEIVQVYVRAVASTVFKPEKELKAFQKVLLQPGESTAIELTLDRQAFASYDVDTAAWLVESGEYEIIAGASSRDLRLKETVTIQSADCVPNRLEALADYYQLVTNKGKITDVAFAALYGQPLPTSNETARKPYTANSTLGDIKGTLIGRILYRIIINLAMKANTDGDLERQLATRKMLQRMMAEYPLRSIAISSGGMLTYGMMEGIVMMANRKFFRGVQKMLGSLPKRDRHLLSPR
ncbi:glycoside hydrolase family 3 domain protein [Ktedonobacter racemifer DSM 44963]|uniref:Glycoside hydrolase family 3 domain protein n=2 Tax=Ktedonobacter racemifer TaxID=363277 RepID=D6TT50_KTERA|nr:glycoside hydrolase family 3 domain protein [Ktedonobacter racemifer DSM 44963]